MNMYGTPSGLPPRLQELVAKGEALYRSAMHLSHGPGDPMWHEQHQILEYYREFRRLRDCMVDHFLPRPGATSLNQAEEFLADSPQLKATT